MELVHDLPAGVTEWVASIGGGTINRLERHVARREAWVVDVRQRNGDIVEGFLRIDRDPQPGNPWSLHKEACIVDALGPSPVPVPQLLGWNDDLTCALFERAPGRSDLDNVTDASQQRAVMEDFMRVVGDLHNLELDALELDNVMAPRPTTAAESALGELDLVCAMWQPFLAQYRDPLITFGIDWLRRNVPAQVSRTSLVQGDTGPVNFLFEGDRVCAVIDWEWGHFGDPMEDLGNICVREFWNPSGGLKGLFDLYERSSGIPYFRDAALYYRVQQNMRGMIPIHAVTLQAQPREPIAWYLAYRYVGDRATCEAIAEAMHVELERPPLPDEFESDEGDGSAHGDASDVSDRADAVFAEAAEYALEHDVMPAVGNEFAKSRANDVIVLVKCIERRRRYRRDLDAIERAEIAALLHTRPSSRAEATAQLDDALREARVDPADALRYLARRSYRDEWLHAPAVALYPNREWSPID